MSKASASASPPATPPRRLPPTWRELHPDGDPAVEALQFAAWAAATPAQKLAQLAGLMRLAHRLARQGVALRNVDASQCTTMVAENSDCAAGTGSVDRPVTVVG
jgi:hypothetical protein